MTVIEENASLRRVLYYLIFVLKMPLHKQLYFWIKDNYEKNNNEDLEEALNKLGIPEPTYNHNEGHVL